MSNEYQYSRHYLLCHWSPLGQLTWQSLNSSAKPTVRQMTIEISYPSLVFHTVLLMVTHGRSCGSGKHQYLQTKFAYLECLIKAVQCSHHERCPSIIVWKVSDLRQPCKNLEAEVGVALYSIVECREPVCVYVCMCWWVCECVSVSVSVCASIWGREE